MDKYLLQVLEAQKFFKKPGIIINAPTGLSPEARQHLRDKLGTKCVLCDSQENLTIDHKLARALGGTNHKSNLQVLCRPCNQAKGHKENALLALIKTTEGRAELLRQFTEWQREASIKGGDEARARLQKRQESAQLAYDLLHGKQAS
jgi:hypothetical protein